MTEQRPYRGLTKEGKLVYGNYIYLRHNDGRESHFIQAINAKWYSSPPYNRGWSHDKFEVIPESVRQQVTKDVNGDDVFKDDEVLVYRGKKNIGEGYVDFNERFLWFVVNNSNQNTDRESPQDWSQLSLCDVDIELIEDEDNE